MEDLLAKTLKLCEMYGVRPSRSKGQNFLINEDTFDFIVDQAGLTKEDTVLEVGPGLGFMTAKLAAKAKQVIAVELDDKLAKALEAGLKSQGVDNIAVVNEDILEVANNKLSIVSCQLSAKTYKVVANLPYNITSMFLRKFLETEEIRPELMVLMLQREVARRMVARPGDMSLLALSVQYFADAEILCYVPARDFYPAPDVESAVIRIKTKSAEEMGIRKNPEVEKKFFRLCKIGFSAKRKMLKNNLAAGLHIGQDLAEKRLIDAGFDPKIRAEALSVDDWLRLVDIF